MVQDDRDDLSQDERRQFDRSRFILDVHFDGGEATGVASTKDMSLGGLYMNTQAEIPENATLTLRIPIAGQHVVVKAEVVYVNPGRGVGVRFHRLSEESRAIMERAIASG